MKTTNQVQYVTKNVSDLVNSKDVARGFSNTNFAFGDDRPNKISSSHIHYAHYPGGVPEKMNKEQRSQLRSTHFSLGQHPMVKQSVSKQTYGGAQVPHEVRNQNTQQSNFSLGDGPNMYHTTYNSTCALVTMGQNKRTEGCENRSYKSSFEIGGGRFNAKSQFQSSYTPQNQSLAKPDKGFINKIKSDHFSLAEESNMIGQYVTTQKSSYMDVDTANNQNKLDEARKEDLRNSHFEIGNKNVSQFKSVMGSSYQNPPAAPAAFKAQKTHDLKASHFTIGDTNVSDFNTSNTINYKWVQPKCAHVGTR